MAHPDPDRRPELRAADTDRERVAEQLRRAHGEGRLDLGEFDERVAAAWAARTYGDLDVLTADLPPEPATAMEVPVRHPAPPVRRAPDPSAVAAWAGASGFCLLTWATMAAESPDGMYPWWIWVAGPWGVRLLAQWVSAHRGGRAG